jgi:hypothetical protein
MSVVRRLAPEAALRAGVLSFDVASCQPCTAAWRGERNLTYWPIRRAPTPTCNWSASQAAKASSDHTAWAQFAAKRRRVCDGELALRNLDVTDAGASPSGDENA